VAGRDADVLAAVGRAAIIVRFGPYVLITPEKIEGADAGRALWLDGYFISVSAGGAPSHRLPARHRADELQTVSLYTLPVGDLVPLLCYVGIQEARTIN